MLLRSVIVSAGMLLAAFGLGRFAKTEAVPIRQTLASFPLRVAGWQGEAAPALDPQIVAVLGANELLNRAYVAPDRAVIGLFIAYYESQRQGDAIHSPLNCLPGAGWVPVKTGRASVPVDAEPLPNARGTLSRSIEINHYVVQQGLDKLVVFYWYQSHGRVIASEYRSKFYMILDALRMNRTDAALVRVISPVADVEPSGEAVAEQQAVAFVKSLFPLLGRYLPA